MNGTLTTVAMAGDALITKHRFKFVQAYNVCVWGQNNYSAWWDFSTKLCSLCIKTIILILCCWLISNLILEINIIEWIQSPEFRICTVPNMRCLTTWHTQVHLYNHETSFLSIYVHMHMEYYGFWGHSYSADQQSSSYTWDELLVYRCLQPAVYIEMAVLVRAELCVAYLISVLLYTTEGKVLIYYNYGSWLYSCVVPGAYEHHEVLLALQMTS